ncbi:hypothetical protein G3M58_13040 [Streptomyces sp. SID7499]|uniref:VCBS repeat-containing protein n=1 Tax=Streptomyces sp. SID7499 TaxID=2706086 RepID=A0A6G3WPK2_9ACTN|nr:hypothetical protein [Streptomyces sp. SID7499]
MATADIPRAGESEDEFGTTVAAAGDIDKDGRPELFISAVMEKSSTGAVWVLPGGAGGPTARGSRMITASSVGLPQRESTQGLAQWESTQGLPQRESTQFGGTGLLG